MNKRSRVGSTLRLRHSRRKLDASGHRTPLRRSRRTAKDVDEVYAGAVEKIREWIREKQSSVVPGSANHAFLAKMHGLPPDKLFEEILKATNPNRERVGCPPYRILMELATRQRGLSDPWFEHIAHCYRCSVELRPLVRAYMPPDPS